MTFNSVGGRFTEKAPKRHHHQCHAFGVISFDMRQRPLRRRAYSGLIDDLRSAYQMFVTMRPRRAHA